MQTASRFRPFGQTVFAEFTRLAIAHDAINLGQGFPNFDGPDFVKTAALAAMERGDNQYAPMAGVRALNEAIAWRLATDAGLEVDPDEEITVTAGCTEALAATFLGLVDPGDEVVVLEPYYDAYPACIAMAGATARYVTLRPPHFRIEEEELRRAFSDRTRAVVVNTPHNPTGRVFSEDELALVARLCIEHDAIAITDEVYEHLVFGGRHLRMAALDGMRERTVMLSSLGKTFSLTGWKIGWAVASPALTAGLRAAHQFVTFSVATPLQHGAAAALRAPAAYFEAFRDGYRRRRELLVDGLARIGFEVYPPEGTYFVLADHTPFGFDDDVAFCRHLVEHVGVAAIPPSAFYHDPAAGRALVRFAFCKDEETIRAAVSRMADLAS